MASFHLQMNNSPFQRLDSILLKTYLRYYKWYYNWKNKPLKNKDQHAISELASVDYGWFQRIKERTFEKEVWQSLVVLHRKTEKISSVYRINRQYLEENIRLKGLVSRLKSNDCLTDVQAASLYRQNLALEKNSSFKRFRDLSSDILKKTAAVHSNFKLCLCNTKQHLIGEVLEDGGVVVKVEVKLQKAKTPDKTQHQNLELVARINEIQERKKERSHEIEELMGKLEKDDLEILNANHDGEAIIVWIWCKTKDALDKLQTLNESKHIVDVFTELVKNLSLSSEKQNLEMIKAKVNIDFEQYEKTIVSTEAVVFFSIVTNFTSSLELEKGEREGVVGVTKLRDKIYVLLRNLSFVNRCAILVFEDQIPFRLQRRIEIRKKIEYPMDITSIEMENSLYVLDCRRWVCKIKEAGDENEKIIEWMHSRDFSELPETLSVSRDSGLLLIGRRRDDPLWSVNIFRGEGSEEADLLLAIPLPEGIQCAQHIVETSKGNFIIFHLIINRQKEEDNGSDGGRGQMENEKVGVWEVSGDGKTILRRFIPKNEEPKLFPDHFVGHLVVDCLDRVFLADSVYHRVILFDSDLQWKGILFPTVEEKEGSMAT